MMATAFRQAEVIDFQGLIDAMPNDPKDRHVAAAAVKGGAQVIVTQNLKDFGTLPEGLEAESPDDFLRNLLGLYPDEMLELLRQQASALKRPPLTLEDVLAGLATIVPRFVAAVRERLDSLP